MVVAALVGSVPLGQYIAAPGISWNRPTYETFDGGFLLVPTGLKDREGFEAGQDGWYLASGQAGKLVYAIEKSRGSHVAMQVWMYAGNGAVKGNIRAAWKNDEFKSIAVEPQVSGSLFEFPPEADAVTRIDVEFTARNAGPNHELVLTQLVWGELLGTPARAPPPFSSVALGVLVALGMVPFLGRGRSGYLVAIGVGSLVAAGSFLRVTALAESALLPLDPDATGYRSFGEVFEWSPLGDHGLFSANFGIREPFFPLVVHAFFSIIGSSDFHLRVVSATLSVAVVLLSILAARQRVQWLLALAVGLFVAFNGRLVAESVRGLRTELEMVLLLLVYLALDGPRGSPKMTRGVSAGVVGAALVLTRSFYLPMVVIAGAVAFLSLRWPRRHALITLAIFGAIVGGAAAGHRLAEQVRYGDAFDDTALQARWYANAEWYRYHRPLLHPEFFPMSPAEEAMDPWSGPRLSYAEYLFGLHSFSDVIGDTLQGFADFVRDLGGLALPFAWGPVLNGKIDKAATLASILGLFALLGRFRQDGRNLILPVMILGTLSFSMFLLHRALMEPQRNTIVVYPLMLIAGSWLAAKMPALLNRVRTRLHLRPRQFQ